MIRNRIIYLLFCRGKDISLMYCQLKVFFKDVVIVKPKSSRNSSIGIIRLFIYAAINGQLVCGTDFTVYIEAFALCRDYTPPLGYIPTMINPILDLHYGNHN